VAFLTVPLVFAGYGIVAPEYQWNDYAGLDAKARRLVVLVNDPGSCHGTRRSFRQNHTYYGR